MDREEILEIFRKSEALLDGHFILTSGRHSAQYFQCAKVLQFPEYARKLCYEIAKHFSEHSIHTVIAPAVGGIVVGYEVARQIGSRSIFAERENGAMTLRRGFSLHKGDKVVVCEDVTTTGGSVKEILKLVEDAEARLMGVGCIVDRSGGTFKPTTRFVSCIEMDAVSYAPEECPICAQGIPAAKPGSRALAK